MRGFLKDTFVMFGRVPFAFYVAHFYLLHLLSLGSARWQGIPVSQLMTFPPFYPAGYGLSLAGVYGVWAAGHRAAVSVLPLGGDRQGAQPRLVAQLRLKWGQTPLLERGLTPFSRASGGFGAGTW